MSFTFPNGRSSKARIVPPTFSYITAAFSSPKLHVPSFACVFEFAIEKSLMNSCFASFYVLIMEKFFCSE